MKKLHRDDLYGWSVFDPTRNIDFHSVVWHRPKGNIVIDPLPMSEHDFDHLQSLGGARWIVVTNSDHLRDAPRLADVMRAGTMGPRCEAATFPLRCDHWLADEVDVVPGLEAFELHGSKTPGELALVLEGTTLITGDLIRCHRAGELAMLPDNKLTDKAKAVESLRHLSYLPDIDAVLVGDGWPVFRGGHQALKDLVARVSGP